MANYFWSNPVGSLRGNARGLVSSQNTRAAEKKIRSAASVRFGRGKARLEYEHGQWFAFVDDPEEDRDVIYSVVDAIPGVGGTGIDFESLG
jgi:hypothetical protein